MTLDEAIRDAEGQSRSLKRFADSGKYNVVKDMLLESASKQSQLAMWLRELKERRKKED